MRFIDAVDNTTAPEDALKDFIGLPLRETYVVGGVGGSFIRLAKPWPSLSILD